MNDKERDVIEATLRERFKAPNFMFSWQWLVTTGGGWNLLVERILLDATARKEQLLFVDPEPFKTWLRDL